MKKLGMLVPIVTACTKKGAPDLEGVKAVSKYFLDAGAHGIFVCGSTGRGPWFTKLNRIKICKAAAEQIGSKVPLFAGCVGMGSEDIIENANAMADSGASAIVLPSLCYFNYSPQELEYIFLQIADASPLPVMIYDIPAFTGAKLDTGMICRLARHENVIGFKDSSGNIDRFNELKQILDNTNDYYLIQGKEKLLASSILNGASGFTVSLAHIAPKYFVSLYNHAVQGKVELALSYQAKVSHIYDIFKDCIDRRPEISTLFHFLNYALKKQGVCENIILEHEMQPPDWLIKQADRAIDILNS